MIATINDGKKTNKKRKIGKNMDISQGRPLKKKYLATLKGGRHRS